MPTHYLQIRHGLDAGTYNTLRGTDQERVPLLGIPATYAHRESRRQLDQSGAGKDCGYNEPSVGGVLETGGLYRLPPRLAVAQTARSRFPTTHGLCSAKSRPMMAIGSTIQKHDMKAMHLGVSTLK